MVLSVRMAHPTDYLISCAEFYGYCLYFVEFIDLATNLLAITALTWISALIWSGVRAVNVSFFTRSGKHRQYIRSLKPLYYLNGH